MSVLQTLVPKSGLKVMICGGAAGIGASLAEAFAEAGADIHVCDVSEAALESFRQKFPNALATRADVGRPEDIGAVFAAHEARFGGLDVLVNNAGVAGPTAGIDAIDDAAWTKTIDVNLNAQYRFANRAVPLLKRSSAAQIICISSVAGRLGYAWRWPYAATNWAIVGLM